VVVLNAASLPAAVMQEVTREVRQFETAFLTEVDLAGGSARLRQAFPWKRVIMPQRVLWVRLRAARCRRGSGMQRRSLFLRLLVPRSHRG
jgi:hypothetical protein